MSGGTLAGSCPTCRARYRGAAVCSRCGADLTVLMRLEIRAWRLREGAREALLAEDAPRALRLAGMAERIHATDRGRALLTAARLLEELR